jgi:hypothetical protein
MNRGSWQSDVLCLGILAGLCLLIGVQQIRKSALINPDGVVYIGLGQRLPGDYVGVARTYPPGYPWILWGAHRAAMLAAERDSPMLWLYSAQAVTLLCRILALIPLYFLGKLFVGARRSFWALVILCFLPYPAQYAADVLREWPYVLFLSLGFWLLCRTLCRQQWWGRAPKRNVLRLGTLLAPVGLIAGLGYAVRPESGQLILYTLLGLASIGLADRRICKLTLAGAGLLAVAGFLVPVAPYVRATRTITPHQLQPPAAKGPPIISAIGSRAASDDPLEFHVQAGESLELPVQASDALGAPLTFSLAGIPVGSRPIYEFWSPSMSTRFWTTSESEKSLLLSTHSRKVWDWGGIVGYAYARPEAQAGLQGVWRLWSPTRLRHFYTIDEQEKEILLTGSARDTWISEGVAFYVWPADNHPPGTVPMYRFGSKERGYSWAVKDSTACQNLSADEARGGVAVWYVHPGGAPPAGATIEGGVFRWRPSRGQKGSYEINIIGGDGQLESCQLILVRVLAGEFGRRREYVTSSPLQYAGIGMLPEAVTKIFTGVAEDLMVVFFVPWLLGLLWRLRYQAERTERVLIVAVVVVNVALILGRHLRFGLGDDRRYALGMIALTIFYVPVGIEILARWLNSVRPLPCPRWLPGRLSGSSWFHLFVAAGLMVCLPKLLMTSPGNKAGYRAAATWLQQNTSAHAVLAVPDIRIGFYAQRQGLLYVRLPDARGADYVIMIDDGTPCQTPEQWHREYSVRVDRRTRKTLVIYSTARPPR